MCVGTQRTFRSLVCAHEAATREHHDAMRAVSKRTPHREPAVGLLLAFGERDPVGDAAAVVVAVVLHRVQQVLRLEGEVGPAAHTNARQTERCGEFELATHSKMKTSIAVLNIGTARSARM